MMSGKFKKHLGNTLIFVLLFLVFFGMDYLVENVTVVVENILIWILAGVAVIGGGGMLVGSLRSSFKIARPPAIDVSQEGRQLQLAQGTGWRDKLLAMGFQRAGEYQDPSYQPGTGWCFFDEKRRIYVEIAETMGYSMLQFTSVFGEKSVVETILSTIPIPDRNEVDEETYRLQIIRGNDLDAAYQAHLAATQDFTIRFGAPVSMPPFAEAITWLPSTYTDRYRRAKFKPNVIQALGFTAFFGAFAVLIGLVKRYKDPTDLQFAQGMAFLSLIFMISPMIIPLPVKSVIIFELGMLATIGVAFSLLAFGGWVGLAYGLSLVACLLYLLLSGSKQAPVKLVRRQEK
jgi:hypothetical protein